MITTNTTVPRGASTPIQYNQPMPNERPRRSCCG